MTDGGGDPAGLLASLTAMSSGVTRIGSTTIRGVPATGYALKVDPAKAAGTVPAADRATIEALRTLVGVAEIPVDVWVDGHNLVRQERLGASPPPESGTLTPDQVTSAEQAVTAFWAALGSNKAAAVAATVLPAQQSCVQSSLGSGAPTIAVSGLRITSAQPAGDSSATVRFTVTAKASLGGQTIPVFPQAPGSAQWLVTTEVAGRWYVNIEDSTALVFAGACG